MNNERFRCSISSRNAYIFCQVLDGAKMREMAAEYKISEGRIREIFWRVARILRGAYESFPAMVSASLKDIRKHSSECKTYLDAYIRQDGTLR